MLTNVRPSHQQKRVGVAVAPPDEALSPVNEARLRITVSRRFTTETGGKDNGMPDRRTERREIFATQTLEAHESAGNIGGLGTGRDHALQSGWAKVRIRTGISGE